MSGAQRGDLLSGIWTARVAPVLSPRDWETLLAQASAARLLARLAHLYEDRGWLASAPTGPRRHLESARRFADRLHHEVQWEIDHIVDALRDVPTPIVLLKGAGYVRTGLPPSRGRVFSDVDIMVRRDQLEAVEAALFRKGWLAEKLSPYDDRYYRTWMHELPPLQHVLRQTALDVHHTIAPPTSRFAIDGDRLLAGAVSITDEPRLSVLAPADMALHSAVHLMQEGEWGGGLRDLLDLNDLLIHFGQDASFWPTLIERARTLGATVPMHDTLTQIERLFGTRPPAACAAALDAMAPGRLRSRSMAALLRCALEPQHESCDRAATRLSRQLLYVRSHWLRMPWYQIGPHLVRKAVMRAVAVKPPSPPAPEPQRPTRDGGP